LHSGSNTDAHTDANTGSNTDAHTDANTGSNTDAHTDANTGQLGLPILAQQRMYKCWSDLCGLDTTDNIGSVFGCLLS
jgi:hypothetical protein